MQVSIIEIADHDGVPMVSSKHVAEKFAKRHDDFLKAYRNTIAALQDVDFIARNFAENKINTLRGTVELTEVMMTRDGFSLLAFGLNGHHALQWKVKFLEAFNSLGKTVLEYQKRIISLELEKSQMQLRLDIPAKKPGATKGTVLVPVPIETIFGLDLDWRRAKREDARYSDLSRMEGELHRLNNCMEGMQRKARSLADKICVERRR